MSRFSNLTSLLCFVLICAGCNKQEKEESKAETSLEPAAAEFIAVIDLNVVAQEIGAQTKIDLSLKQKEEELLRNYNGLKAELGRKVADHGTAGGDLNDQQQNRLDQLNAENQNTLTLQAQAAQSQLIAYHGQLKQKLLAEIRPVAYTVAKEKGMQIVLTVGQVYAAGPNVNITQDVVKRIQAINKSSALSQSADEPPVRISELPGGGEFVPR